MNWSACAGGIYGSFSIGVLINVSLVRKHMKGEALTLASGLLSYLRRRQLPLHFWLLAVIKTYLETHVDIHEENLVLGFKYQGMKRKTR